MHAVQRLEARQTGVVTPKVLFWGLMELLYVKPRTCLPVSWCLISCVCETLKGISGCGGVAQHIQGEQLLQFLTDTGEVPHHLPHRPWGGAPSSDHIKCCACASSQARKFFRGSKTKLKAKQERQTQLLWGRILETSVISKPFCVFSPLISPLLRCNCFCECPDPCGQVEVYASTMLRTGRHPVSLRTVCACDICLTVLP